MTTTIRILLPPLIARCRGPPTHPFFRAPFSSDPTAWCGNRQPPLDTTYTFLETLGVAVSWVPAPVSFQPILLSSATGSTSRWPPAFFLGPAYSCRSGFRGVQEIHTWARVDSLLFQTSRSHPGRRLTVQDRRPSAERRRPSGRRSLAELPAQDVEARPRWSVSLAACMPSVP